MTIRIAQSSDSIDPEPYEKAYRRIRHRAYLLRAGPVPDSELAIHFCLHLISAQIDCRRRVKVLTTCRKTIGSALKWLGNYV